MDVKYMQSGYPSGNQSDYGTYPPNTAVDYSGVPNSAYTNQAYMGPANGMAAPRQNEQWYGQMPMQPNEQSGILGGYYDPYGAPGMQQQNYSGAGAQAQPVNAGDDYDSFINGDSEMPGMQQDLSKGKKARIIKSKPVNRRGASRKNWIWAGVIVLVIALVAFILIRNAGNARPSTATIVFGQMGESHSGTALIVRDETAYSEEGVQSIDYVADEGTVVKRGDVICRVYSTGYNAKEMTTLQDYRDQIKDYQQSLLSQETSYDQKMTRLETNVVERGLEARSLVQGTIGDMKQQEETLADAITERQSYFRSKYSSDMRMDRLFDNEETQQQRIDSWIKQKISPTESIVSFYTDGFEALLTPDTYQSYSPSEVRSMIAGNKPSSSSSARGKTDLYRLIRQDNFAVLLLLDDTNWNPEEGKSYKLVLEQYTDMVVDARVLSFTRSGGELLVRLAVIGDIAQILYTRSCSAKLGEYVDCMAVPESALFRQNDMTGVVLLDGDRSIFIPVNVLDKANGTAYISPAGTGTLSEGQVVRLFY